MSVGDLRNLLHCESVRILAHCFASKRDAGPDSLAIRMLQIITGNTVQRTWLKFAQLMNLDVAEDTPVLERLFALTTALNRSDRRELVLFARILLKRVADGSLNHLVERATGHDGFHRVRVHVHDLLFEVRPEVLLNAVIQVDIQRLDLL